MQIKLTYYNLMNTGIKIEHGMQVCPSNGANSVGTVIDISKTRHESSWREENKPATVTVLWGTGKKRGKKMEHPIENLTSFTAYLTQVRKEYDLLTALQAEARSTGM